MNDADTLIGRIISFLRKIHSAQHHNAQSDQIHCLMKFSLLIFTAAAPDTISATVFAVRGAVRNVSE